MFLYRQRRYTHIIKSIKAADLHVKHVELVGLKANDKGDPFEYSIQFESSDFIYDLGHPLVLLIDSKKKSEIIRVELEDCLHVDWKPRNLRRTITLATLFKDHDALRNIGPDLALALLNQTAIVEIRADENPAEININVDAHDFHSGATVDAETFFENNYFSCT